MNEVKVKTDSLLAAFEGNFCMIFLPSPQDHCLLHLHMQPKGKTQLSRYQA